MFAQIFFLSVIIFLAAKVEVEANINDNQNAESLSRVQNSVDNFSHGAENQFKEKCQSGERCVPYYHCIENESAGIFNIRSTLDNMFLPCESLRQCCEFDNIKVKIPQFEMPKSCGYRNAEGLGRYSVGKQKESQYGEFPWVSAILKRYKFGSSVVSVFMSAGSLIHPSIVLTTAHNLNNTDVNDLLVRAGEWNTQSDDEMFKHQERDVQGITYHRDFKRINLHNDIALLFLVNPFNLAPHINTICLPQQNYDYSGEKCLASGWGKDKFGVKGNYQVFLKKVELPIVDSDECQDLLRKTRLGEDFILHSGFMCAGGEKDIDTCTGDGGSPLVCSIPGNPDFYYQAGIVSWGVSCNIEGVPGVYINLRYYLQWIHQQVVLKGFNL